MRMLLESLERYAFGLVLWHLMSKDYEQSLERLKKAAEHNRDLIEKVLLSLCVTMWSTCADACCRNGRFRGCTNEYI